VLKLSLLWIAALVVSLALVKLTKIGPVIFVISAEHSWGVHSGDLLVVIPMLAALTVTLRIVKKRRQA
jgi:hypothetical protein